MRYCPMGQGLICYSPVWVLRVYPTPQLPNANWTRCTSGVDFGLWNLKTKPVSVCVALDPR